MIIQRQYVGSYKEISCDSHRGCLDSVNHIVEGTIPTVSNLPVGEHRLLFVYPSLDIFVPVLMTSLT